MMLPLAAFNVAPLTEVGLVLFLVIFALVVTWALTRSRQDVDHWAHLPVDTENKTPSRE